MDWRENLIEDIGEIRRLAIEAARIAVLGIKTEKQADQAAFYVPKYMVNSGVEVVPVPVYYPDVSEILGRKVYRSLADIPGELDMVDVFRRPQDIGPHVEDIIAKKPRVAWFQLGIRNDEAAEKLARAGIKVVQDRCLLVEHQRASRLR